MINRSKLVFFYGIDALKYFCTLRLNLLPPHGDVKDLFIPAGLSTDPPPEPGQPPAGGLTLTHLWHIFNHPTQHSLDVSLRRSLALLRQNLRDVPQTLGSAYPLNTNQAWSASPAAFLPEREQTQRIDDRWSDPLVPAVVPLPVFQRRGLHFTTQICPHPCCLQPRT